MLTLIAWQAEKNHFRLKAGNSQTAERGERGGKFSRKTRQLSPPPRRWKAPQYQQTSYLKCRAQSSTPNQRKFLWQAVKWDESSRARTVGGILLGGAQPKPTTPAEALETRKDPHNHLAAFLHHPDPPSPGRRLGRHSPQNHSIKHKHLWLICSPSPTCWDFINLIAAGWILLHLIGLQLNSDLPLMGLIIPHRHKIKFKPVYFIFFSPWHYLQMNTSL